MADRKNAEARQAPAFPTHNSPRTWLLTQGLSPLAVRLMRLLLAHGDCVVACLPPGELADEARSADFRALADECRAPTGQFRDREGWKDRLRGIRCDGRQMGQCTAAVAEAVHVFGRIDILLCCCSEAIVGAVEELAAQDGAAPAVRDQFDTVFFSQVNLIRATLPQLRAQHTGHIVVLSSVGGHIGMPGMPVYIAATAALEGYCDSLAYEIAPFNVKVTIVQPVIEVQILTNRITLAPTLPAYASAGRSDASLTPSVRDILSRVLNTCPETAVLPATGTSRYPRLPDGAVDRLVLETVHALAAIGGHENPPSRHIVGFEASAAVQDKLKTATEELEDFVEASLSVDIFDSELKAEARKGRSLSGLS